MCVGQERGRGTMLKPSLPGLRLFPLQGLVHVTSMSTSREQCIVVDDQFTLIFTCLFHGLSVPIPELYFLRLRKQRASISIGHRRHPQDALGYFPSFQKLPPKTTARISVPAPNPTAHYPLTMFLLWPVHSFAGKKNPLNNFARLKKLTELINCDRMTWEERKEFEESMDINSV